MINERNVNQNNHSERYEDMAKRKKDSISFSQPGPFSLSSFPGRREDMDKTDKKTRDK